MSTYATTHVLELADQDTTILVNRNLLEDPDAAVRLDVIADDATGPAVILTTDQAEELGVAILEAAGLVYPPTGGAR